jgi:uncharacterized protein YutE (UPF0331/DUF86 family)
MVNDVVTNKIEIIERCIKRINEEYRGDPANLANMTKQDSIVLNLQRACEAAIALAMHIVADKALGVPQTSRDAFTLLEENQLIDKKLGQCLKAMVGFRNIAVHDYQDINQAILQSIIEKEINDLQCFARVILKQLY